MIPSDTTRCDKARHTLHDIRASEIDRARSRAHVRSCADCAAEAQLAGALRTGSPPSTLDNTAWVASVRRSRSQRPITGLLIALAMATTVQSVLGLAWLLGENPAAPFLGRPSGEHLARDGALGLLLSAAAISCLVRPRWARALSPVCLVIVAIHLVGGLLDRHEGRVAWHFEAVHGIGLAMVGMVLLVAAVQRRRGPLGS